MKKWKWCSGDGRRRVGGEEKVGLI